VAETAGRFRADQANRPGHESGGLIRYCGKARLRAEGDVMSTLKLWMLNLLNRRPHYGHVTLAKGKAHGRIVSRPEVVFVRRGSVWLSAEPGMRLDGRESSGDVVLERGQCLELSGSGRAVLQALQDAVFEVAPVAEAPCTKGMDDIPHAELLRASPLLR
jgi:hypothetical protein